MRSLRPWFLLLLLLTLQIGALECGAQCAVEAVTTAAGSSPASAQAASTAWRSRPAGDHSDQLCDRGCWFMPDQGTRNAGVPPLAQIAAEPAPAPTASAWTRGVEWLTQPYAPDLPVSFPARVPLRV